MGKHPVNIFNLTLLEPGTLISDIALAMACFLFFRAIRRIACTKNHHQLSYFFLFMAFSSLFGAIAHSLFLYTGKSLHYITWILTGISIFFIEFSVSSNINNEKGKNLLLMIVKVKLLIFFIICSIFLNFVFVKLNTAIGFLGIVFPIILFQSIKFEIKSYWMILAGIILAIIPALLHREKYEIAQMFNMNDISHFFLIVCVYLIYRGFKIEILKYQYINREQFTVKLNN
jgi:hypothetical protein